MFQYVGSDSKEQQCALNESMQMMNALAVRQWTTNRAKQVGFAGREITRRNSEWRMEDRVAEMAHG
jgi:hypothetical protein